MELLSIWPTCSYKNESHSRIRRHEQVPKKKNENDDTHQLEKGEGESCIAKSEASQETDKKRSQTGDTDLCCFFSSAAEVEHLSNAHLSEQRDQMCILIRMLDRVFQIQVLCWYGVLFFRIDSTKSRTQRSQKTRQLGRIFFCRFSVSSDSFISKRNDNISS